MDEGGVIVAQIFPDPDHTPLEAAWSEYSLLTRQVLDQPELLADRDHFTKRFRARIRVEQLLMDGAAV